MMTKRTSSTKSAVMKTVSSSLLLFTLCFGVILKAQRHEKISKEQNLKADDKNGEKILPPPPPNYPNPKSAKERAKKANDAKALQNSVKTEAETITPNPPVPPSPPTEIVSETPAEFPGGMGAFRQSVASATDVSKIGSASKKTLSGNVNLVISEEGTASIVNYNFDDENFKNAILAAVQKTIDGKVWKPGTINGKPAASHFKFPVVMNFE